MISAVVIFSPIVKNSKNGITIGTMHTISVAFAAWVHCAPCVQVMKWKASIVAGKNVSRKLRPEYSPRYFLKLRIERRQQRRRQQQAESRTGCRWLALIISTEVAQQN